MTEIKKYTISKILGLITITVGIAVVVGWIADIESLQRFFPNTVTMKFSTAVSFICSGIILYALSYGNSPKSKLFEIMLLPSLFLILLFMGTILLSSLTGISSGMEKLFVVEKENTIHTTVAGRPSLGTIIDFILITLAGIFTFSNSDKLKKSIRWIGIMILIVGGVALIGYAINYPLLYYTHEISTAMAAHTAILFVLLGAGFSIIDVKLTNLKQLSPLRIRTKLLSFLLIISFIPLLFLGAMSYNVALHRTTVDVLQQSILLISVVSGVFIILFSIFLSSSISRPLEQLRKASEQLARGNYSLATTEYFEDEAKELLDVARSFNYMNEEVKKAHILKDEFSAMVTHELKTPLVPILGYCKMFKTSMFGQENKEQAEAIEVIERNAKRLENLITDIMDARKLDIDKMRFILEDVSLNEFFETIDSSFKKILKEKGIQYITNLQIKDLVIQTDRVRLRQVFDNLINNSIKFMPENNGIIEVGDFKKDDSLVLYVKDNGSGIPKEKQKELFKKYYQVDTSERRPIGGTGLGLAISKGITEKLGGHISVESDGKNGTTFYLKFPLLANI